MHTIILLTISNIFMTFAWYGHLKYKNVPLWQAILVSWGIAFVEYCFQVPANRIGHYEFTAALCVFSMVFEGAAQVELSGGLRDDGGGRVLRVQGVVNYCHQRSYI